MADDRGFLFTLLDKEFFENLDRYQPTEEFLSLVEGLVGEGWQLRPAGFWAYCTPIEAEIGAQGWKIHVSAVAANGAETLRRVVPLLAAGRVPFKFASDPGMARLANSKNWPRTGAGKFLTIYPRDEAAFVSLIEAVHAATADLGGPYLLTDRPFRDSRVVFYRYGEHRSGRRVDASGAPAPVLVGPGGEEVSDERRPFFWLPPWVRDPFVDGAAPPPAEAAEVMLNGRYRVTGALRYSAFGGIYTATDTATGREVVIREARPMLKDPRDPTDPQNLLEKEARVLRTLGPTGLVPELVEVFEEGGHRFLVQEKLEAQSLWTYALEYANGYSLAALPPPATLFASIRATVRKLVEGLQAVHARGVVLRDLTKTNVLVTPDHCLKFIDFELAYELEGDAPAVVGWTAGYASPQQRGRHLPAVEDDYYALGALVMDTVAFNAAALPINPEGALGTLKLLLGDIGLPTVLYDVVVGLTDPDPAKRWRPERVLAALDAVEGLSTHRETVRPDRPAERPAPAPALVEEVRRTVDGIGGYLLARADFDRHDRLWPASPEVFTTNPVGVQFGAAGIAWYLLRTRGEVPEAVLAWMRRAMRAHPCPPSLYNGLSGAALFLLEAGREEEAREVMERACVPALVFQLPDLYHGAAGWGLANLHFWRATGDEAYRERAREAGEHLVRSARRDAAGAFWEGEGGKVTFGLGHGQAGIATFLLYLNAAAPDAAWLETAEAALDFELAHAERHDGRVHWVEKRGMVVGPRLPHMRYGTAGVGSAVLRFAAVTGQTRWKTFLGEAAQTVANRYSNKLWQDFGLAGFGEYLLDLHRFLGEETYLHNAFHLAESLVANRIEKPGGFAFAGVEQMRIGCEVGMGSAGIGLFLHRLLHPRTPRILFPDEMLEAAPAGGAARPDAALAGA